jgi:hypothetical protein
MHGSSRSPIKKQLAKRIVTYFDQLDDARSRERSSERKGSRSRSTSKRSVIEYEKDVEPYEDVELRKKKLEDLKELMKKELFKAKTEGVTQPQPDDIYKSVHGYPSFMKSSRTHEQYRRKPTAEADLHAFKKSIHKLLEERVLKAEGKNIEEEESMDIEELHQSIVSPEKYQESVVISKDPNNKSGEENLFDEQLYPIETKKTIKSKNSIEGSAFDFHQRKSKEIRRLQYAASFKERESSPRITQERKSTITEYRTRKPAETEEKNNPNQNTLTGRQRERRTHPDEGYPVWVRLIVEGEVKEIPAMLKHLDGFKINPETDTMEVVEKDRVNVHPYDNSPPEHVFQIIGGKVERPNPSKIAFEEECELVVQDAEGNRHPILFYERNKPADDAAKDDEVQQAPPEPHPKPRTRIMEEANCRVFDTIGKFLGRGKLALEKFDKNTGEPIRYAKGILLNSEEKIEFVLVKFYSEKDVALKRRNLSNTQHLVEDTEIIEMSGYKVRCITLVEKNQRATPELLFLLDGEYIIQKSRLLDGESSTCELEDWRLFEGTLNYEEAPNDREGTLWLVQHQQNQAFDSMIQADNFASGDGSYSSNQRRLTGSKVWHEKVRIELDETDPENDISNLLDRIKLILQTRKSTSKKTTTTTTTTTVIKKSEITQRKSVVEAKPLPAAFENLEITVNCPGGHKLRIYLRPKGKGKDIETIIKSTFSEPVAKDPQQLFSIVADQTVLRPDGERQLLNRNQEIPATINQLTNRYDVRVVQFTEENLLEEEERIRREKEQQRLRLEQEEQERIRIQREQEEARKKKEAEDKARREKEENDRLIRLELERLKREAEAAEQQRIKAEEEERLRKKREADAAAERLRIQAEEEERLRKKREADEAAERLRIQAEEEERLRKKREAEAAEQLRIQAEEEERLRKKREAEAAELLRIQAEEEERLRKKREAEAAELLRIQAEEQERLRKKRESEAAELLRIQAEEEERLRKKREADEAAERLRIQAEEEERLRKLRDAEELQKQLALEEERLRKKREAEAEELKRIQAEEEERLRRKREEEAEQLRIQAEEEERLRKKREAEAAELLRIQAEEEERLRKKQEAEAAELKRIQAEEEERLRKKRETEAAELLRLQAEEEERAKKRREAELAELLRIQAEEEERQRRKKEAELLQRQQEEEAERLRKQREAEEIKRLQDEENKRIKNDIERKKREAEAAELLRIQAEEEERLRKQREAELKRIEHEEAERARLKREAELADLLRSQAEEEERARKRREAEQAELKRVQAEHDERHRKKRDAEAAELLRIQAEEEERQRRRREAESQEIRRLQKEEEEKAKLRKSTDSKISKAPSQKKKESDEEEERRRQLEEIEQTQRKVRELKEALQKSRVETSSQELNVIKKTDKSGTSNRYALGESNESEVFSKKADSQIKQTQEMKWELKEEVERVSVPSKPKEPSKPASKPATSKQSAINKSVNNSDISRGHRKSEIVVIKKSTAALSDNDPKQKSIKYDGKKAATRKSEIGLSSHAVQRETNTQSSRIRETQVNTTNQREIHESTLVVQEGKYTKIELNLENSEDDIDFIGYGTIKVHNKKDRSPSPHIKGNFVKISPARDIAAEVSKREERMVTTRAFTPISKQSERKEVQVITTSKKSVISSSQVHQQQASAEHHDEMIIYNNRAAESLSEEERAALVIQYRYRFRIFRIRLLNSREYHNELASQFTQEQLFEKYILFVRSLPNPTYSKKSFTIFIATIVDFKDD